jgi:excinuclease ABC subunit A
LGLADDIVVINTYEGGDQLFSRRLACVTCGISMPEMTPRAFSFNSPHGACVDCQGLGATYDFDPRLIVPDESKSLLGGAVAPWAHGDRKLLRDALAKLSHTFGFDPDMPFSKLGKKHRDLLLFGPPAGATKGTVKLAKPLDASMRRRMRTKTATRNLYCRGAVAPKLRQRGRRIRSGATSKA